MKAATGDPDWPIRAAAFKAVERLSVEAGWRIPWGVIERGFEYRGERIRLASKALGIFKPRQMSAALSIKTTKPRAGRPSWYRDQGAGTDTDTGLVSYDLVHKRGHWTNDALGRAFERRAPLIYFRAVESSWYEAIWPVWVVGGRRYGPKGREFRAGNAGWRFESGKVVFERNEEVPKPPGLVQ